MLWKLQSFTLQSMGRKNDKFPVYMQTRNVQAHLKSTSIVKGGSKINSKISL